MASLENDGKMGMGSLGACTRLVHSFDELTVPQAPGACVARKHVLQCDAFRVEYTTEMKGSEKSVTDVAIIPYCLPGLKEDAYRLSPEPNAALTAKLTEALSTTQANLRIGLILLYELSSVIHNFPEYSWVSSAERGIGIKSDDGLGIPILPSYYDYVTCPQWNPHYITHFTLGGERHSVAVVMNFESISFTFRINRKNPEEKQLPQTLHLRYSGPPLGLHEHPVVMGERIADGIREIIKHSRLHGALNTYAALASTSLKVQFLEVDRDTISALERIPVTGNVKPLRCTLASGAVTHLRIDLDQSVAVIRIQAHAGSDAASLEFKVSEVAGLSRDAWLADITKAYRQISSSSESTRLCGFYALRRLRPEIKDHGTTLSTLLGEGYAQKIERLKGEFEIGVSSDYDLLSAISEMLPICEGVQNVYVSPFGRMNSVSMFRRMNFGFAPNGTLFFSAKNDVGGAFDGVLDTSMFKDVGEQRKAFDTLLDAFVKQIQLEDRRHFEEVAHALTNSDKSGCSYIISEGHTFHCSLPPRTDAAACAAYEVAADILNKFSAIGKSFSRSSAHYAEAGTCHVILAYPVAPFEMGFVIKGSLLTEINFSPALPPYSDKIRRKAPSLRVSTELELINNPQSDEAIASLMKSYVRYGKESLNRCLVRPLSDSDVYRAVQALAAAPINPEGRPA